MRCINKIGLFIIGTITVAACGTKITKKKADNLFKDRSYVEAAKIYEQLPQDRAVLENLADSYYYNAEMQFASKVYGQLYFTYKDSLSQEYLFRYANALRAIEDYERSDKIMSDYLNYPVDIKKFKEYSTKIVPYNYQLKSITNQGGYGDFGIAFYADTLVFASGRNPDAPIYEWNKKAYLDLYMGNINKDGMLDSIRLFPPEINTATHESSAVFTKDGNTMYFNRTNETRVKVGKEYVANIKIFKAEKVNGKWTNIQPLSFNNDAYSCMHPALSLDEKRLYFSSDMPGTVGGMDLFYVDIQENGAFGAPVNLGTNVNTPHREQFPTIADDGYLYFSSDGHEGLGSLDLFMTRAYDDEFAKPLNLGGSINSGYDDFAFALKPNDSIGFFTSNRLGDDYLYSFFRTHNERSYTVSGAVRDKYSKQLLPGTKVNLYNEKDQLIGQLLVGQEANYVFNIEPDKKYRIEAFRDKYIPYFEDIVSDEDGKIEYIIEMTLETYDDAEDIVITKDDGFTYIVLENIYFEFNKSKITEEAASTLNTLVNLLKKYPYMEVELGAHTDSRANETYNLKLSHSRAAAALEYLVSMGIERRRLRSKGYGETKQLVKCGNDCNDEEHAINRRCEFIIIK